MSTSVPNAKRNRLRRTALAYGILTAFCGVFSIVYLQFSYGESSPFLVFLFAPPLLLGFLPALLLGRSTVRIPQPSRRLWNSGVAALTTGFLVRAVINISGRYTDYDTIYWALAAALFLAAILRFLIERRRKQKAALA